ncbi:MAG: anthranilate phosphoribosyltransferase, partial [Anaerolineae bacterium]|nr:anthranilate phosphoribosyltransferase [Anaerolineae bacterium]
CVDEVGIGFLFAAKLHPAMKYVISPRREMGVRSIFNILGPLTNPAGARRQLMGVFAPDLTDTMAHVLGELGAISAMVVCGYGNMDELTTTGPNTVSHYQDGRVDTYTLDPREYGFHGASISDLMGGDAPLNASILRGVLDGTLRDAKRDIVLLNAGAAIFVGGKAGDIAEGIKIASEVIDNGVAVAKLDGLIAFTKQFVA